MSREPDIFRSVVAESRRQKSRSRESARAASLDRGPDKYPSRRSPAKRASAGSCSRTSRGKSRGIVAADVRRIADDQIERLPRLPWKHRVQLPANWSRKTECDSKLRGARHFSARNREPPPKYRWRRSPPAAIRGPARWRCSRNRFPHPQFATDLRPPRTETLQRNFDHVLGLRPGDQHTRTDLEFEPPKLLAAGEVLRGNTFAAALDELRVGCSV